MSPVPLRRFCRRWDSRGCSRPPTAPRTHTLYSTPLETHPARQGVSSRTGEPGPTPLLSPATPHPMTGYRPVFTAVSLTCGPRVRAPANASRFCPDPRRGVTDKRRRRTTPPPARGHHCSLPSDRHRPTRSDCYCRERPAPRCFPGFPELSAAVAGVLRVSFDSPGRVCWITTPVGGFSGESK